jgi:beta-galactosidase
MVYILPHWNHHGLEGRSINIWVYTNCEEVELFLNGESLGRKTIEPFSHGEWDVPYTPGEIKAIGYRDAKEVAKAMHCTAGRAYALALKEDTAPIHADSGEVALFTCTVTDECGRVIPDAESFVRFEADNGAEIVATGSANFDHVPPYISERRMYMGRITVAVHPKNAGKVTLYAYSDGLRTAVLDFEVLKKREESEIAYTVGSKVNAGHV